MENHCHQPASSSLGMPRHNELSSEQLNFLDQHFRTHKDLQNAPNLLSSLCRQCSDLNTDHQHLLTSLTKRSVSWISRSFTAKTVLENLILGLQNLSLLTSQHGIGSKKFLKVLKKELPQLAEEVIRIEAIRSYVETTLQLEALVGDLEDDVFCFMNSHSRNMFSAIPSNSSIATDFATKHEKFLKAIEVMNRIEEVLVDLVKLQPQWHHLWRSVDSRVDKALSIIRPQISADHRALLISLGWPPKLSKSETESAQISDLPNPLILMRGEKRKNYSQSFIALCALQHLQARREARHLNLFGQEMCKICLWAIDELVSPIASRMEYHFSKWLDQPEFIFTLTYKITRDFISEIDHVLQPLIDKVRIVSYSAKEAWVSAMVKMLSGFLSTRVFPVLAKNYNDKQLKSEVIPSWLQVVDLILDFDRKMHSLSSSEAFHVMIELERLEGLSGGISMLGVFCDRPDWLKIWAKIELKNAWKKLKTELKDERAWEVDDKCLSGIQFGSEREHYVLSTREGHKAPLIAESALKIAWEMIERCQNMPAILHRIQFIRSTSATFLWYFFKVLMLRCKGTEFAPENPDIDALTRLCVSVNAARYIESQLQQWSDDVNFLEMKVAEIDCHNQRKDDSLGSSCFFNEEIKCLSELQTSWVMEIIAVLLRQFETLSLKYLQDEIYNNQEPADLIHVKVSEDLDLNISSDLVEALDALRSHLYALKVSLNTKDFLDLWRSVAKALDYFICGRGITGEVQFYDKRIQQFEKDMQALFFVFQPFCARPEAFFTCIRDSIKLFKLKG